MSEFEWRDRMRKLNTPEPPARELWPQISARIAQQPRVAPRRDRRRAFAAIAATVALASGAGLLAYRIDRSAAPAVSVPVAATPPTITSEPPPRTALDWAVPSDPKLAAVAETLDKASADLQAALEARPDAVFLVSMINRTNAQRMRLLRQSAISG
ncbi:MAG: hypothetical protein ACREPT_13050 [Rudaea sp.]